MRPNDLARAFFDEETKFPTMFDRPIFEARTPVGVHANFFTKPPVGGQSSIESHAANDDLGCEGDSLKSSDENL